MHHIMFDVDGTLVQSCGFDERCYLQAVSDVLGRTMDARWEHFTHVTDAGILRQYLEMEGLGHRFKQVLPEVKARFTELVSQHLQQQPAIAVAGAVEFLTQLREIRDVSLSIATGGWLATAQLKLESAGLDTRGIPIASSDDHVSRTEIMALARERAEASDYQELTYFGDGLWDRNACAELGYNFVLVGQRTSHHQQIDDFSDQQSILMLLGIGR